MGILDLIKYAPESTTPGLMSAPNPYDWSSLPYLGMMGSTGMGPAPENFGGGDTSTYAKFGLPGFDPNSFSYQSTFGGHSGVTQNPDGTFTAQRRVQNSPDKSAYEQTQYKLSDDGKSLVPVNNQWNPITIKDTGFLESIGDAAKDFGGVLGDALPTLALPIAASFMYPALAGGSAGAAGGAAAGDAAASGVLDLGGGMASGIPAWDAAAAAAGIPLEYAAPPLLSGINTAATNPALIESAVGTPGYGASSAGAGGGAGVLTGTTAGMTPGMSGPTVGGTTAGSGLLGSAGSGLMDFVKSNPNLLGTLLGGLLGGGASGGGGSYNVGNRTPLKPLERPTFTPKQVDYGQGLPGGLGSQSAGLFADYMRRNRGT